MSTHLTPKTIVIYAISFLVFHWLANTLFPPSPVGFDVPTHHSIGSGSSSIASPVSSDDRSSTPCPSLPSNDDNNNNNGESGQPTAPHQILSAHSNYLTLASPIAVLDADTQKIALPDGVSRVCVDVGTYISSPSSKKWWASQPNTFVLGVEANPFSYAMMHYMADPRMASAPGNYWPQYRPGSSAAKEHPGPNCNASEVAYCTQRTWGHITDNYDKFLLVNAAGYDEAQYMSFQMGVAGHPDTGSLYAFKQKKYQQAQSLGKTNLAAIRVGDLLSYMPMVHPKSSERLLYDTLKIDAQGADTSVLMGVGAHVAKFLCVIGEFDVSAYSVRSKERVDVGRHLRRNGFAKVDKNFYVNAKQRSVFESGQYLCRATDEVRSKQAILAAIDSYSG
eukprot:PhM_4_TR17843/c0_g1_i1/m.64991